MCGFLLDAIGQGQHVVRNHPERVVPVLNELGDRLGRMLQVFHILFDEDLNNATEGVAWRKFVHTWIQFAQSTTIQGDDRDSGLAILGRAYDGLFWIGVLREMRRICDERGLSPVTELPKEFFGHLRGSDFAGIGKSVANWVSRGFWRAGRIGGARHRKRR